MTVSFTQDTVIDHTFFPPKSILDPGCFDTVLIVSGTGILLGETYGIKQVCFNIDHPYDEDIRVYLVSPSDVTVELVNNRGGGGDDFINTCFDGNPGSPTIASGMPPFTGSYQSELPLGLINNGGPMDGNWQLFFCDDYNVSEGHIEDFSITFGDNAPVVLVADNDNCNQYFDVAVNNDYKCINYTEGTLSFATASPITSACVGSVFDDDVWFSFIAVDTEHKISVENINPATELIFEVLAGDCNNFTSIICSNSNEFLVNNLSPGSRYYIRIASENNEVNSTLFNVCVSEGIPDPPPNDDYCNAYALNAGNNYCYSGATFAGGTSSSGYPECQGLNFPVLNNDIWFAFVASDQEQLIQVSNMVGTSRFIYFQLFSGTTNCGGSPSENFVNEVCYIDENPGDLIGFVASGLNVGVTYHLRLATYSSPQNTVFDICIENSNPPSNDECVNAILLTVDNCNNSTFYTLSEATQSSQPDSCVNLPEFFDDVWFKFVATGTSHVIDAFNITGSDDDLIFEILSGTCAEPILTFCYDDFPNGSFTLTGLSISTTYYIRVASYLPSTQFIDFNICVKTTSACNLIVLSMEDEGSYSLRNIINCASNNDIILFDTYLSGKTIALDIPTIGINKILILDASTLSENLILSNKEFNNRDVLLDIQNQLTIRGIEIHGLSSESMIVKISAGGELRVQ